MRHSAARCADFDTGQHLGAELLDVVELAQCLLSSFRPIALRSCEHYVAISRPAGSVELRGVWRMLGRLPAGLSLRTPKRIATELIHCFVQGQQVLGRDASLYVVDGVEHKATVPAK